MKGTLSVSFDFILPGKPPLLQNSLFTFVTRFWKISLHVTLKYIELHNLLWPQQKGYRTFQSISNYFLVIQDGNYTL